MHGIFVMRSCVPTTKKVVHETTEYLELFLRNLLLGEHNLLQNRTLMVYSHQKQRVKSSKEIYKSVHFWPFGYHVCIGYKTIQGFGVVEGNKRKKSLNRFRDLVRESIDLNLDNDCLCCFVYELEMEAL